jgi:phage gpG-like protein
MLWIFRTSSEGDIEGVLKIKRNSWLKYERGEPGRYYQDYMKLFITEKELSKNISRVGKSDEYRVRIFLIKNIPFRGKDTNIPFRNEMTNTYENEKELMDVVTKYRVIYGKKVLLSTEYKNYYCPPPPPEPVPPEPKLSAEERRKQSRKKYEDSIRESLREKCRKYYALNVGNQNDLITCNNL